MNNTRKFYIKQFVLNEEDGICELINKELPVLMEDNQIIGYLFTTNSTKLLFQKAYILNLYLIKKDNYHGKIVTIDALISAYESFMIKCATDTTHQYIVTFKNPPIEQWLDTKENWCKKVASEISSTFGWDYNEALSEVYISIMKLYNKGSVYLGNLPYIKKSIYNNVLMNLRANRIRLNGDNKAVQSLDTVLSHDSEDNPVTLGDLIASETEVTEESLEYQLLLKQIKELLRKTFSDREIEQILTYRPMYLPTSLYNRLRKWRQSHNPEELYE